MTTLTDDRPSADEIKRFQQMLDSEGDEDAQASTGGSASLSSVVAQLGTIEQSITALTQLVRQFEDSNGYGNGVVSAPARPGEPVSNQNQGDELALNRPPLQVGPVQPSQPLAPAATPALTKHQGPDASPASVI